MPPKMPPKGKRMPSRIVLKKKKGKEVTPPSSVPNSASEHSDEDAVNRSRSRSRSREVTPPPSPPSKVLSDSQPKKRVKVASLKLTELQEGEVAEWLKQHDFIYVKGRSQYKDTGSKKKLWDELALKMGVNLKALTTWYESTRTKIGKLLTDKSGSATKELSERDQFLKVTFSFLGNHIVRQPSRLAVSLKSRLAAQQPQTSSLQTVTDSDDDIPNPVLVPEPEARTRPPQKFKGKSKARDPQGDQLLETIREQQQQATQLQGKITGLLEPPRMSPATHWGSWMGSMAESFHPMVMEQFYKESLDLVNRCNTMSRQLQQQDAQAQAPPTFAQPQPLPRPTPAFPQPQQQTQQQTFVQPQQQTFAQPQQQTFVQPWQQRTFVTLGEGQTPAPPAPPPLQQQRSHSVDRAGPSDVIDWTATRPPTRPSSTPVLTPSALIISGLSDMTFSSLLGAVETPAPVTPVDQDVSMTE